MKYTSDDPRVTKDHVFTIEKIGDEYQAVYPESFADLSALWPTEDMAWNAIFHDCNYHGIAIRKVD